MLDNYDGAYIKTMKVLVSVVMATYKGVKYEYLIQAIDSILRQDFHQYELIIVADGELTNAQNEFFISLEESHECVSVLSLFDNVGPGAARNHGIKYASGKYIAVMDSDDISLPYRFSTEVAFLEKNPSISIVGSACQVIDETGLVISHRYLPEDSMRLRQYAPFFCPLNNPTVMGRSAVMKKFGYKENMRIGEDHRLWLELLEAGHHLSNINKPLLKFRVDSDSHGRRVGLDKAVSDWTNRLYGMRIAPFYKKPFVLTFAFIMFLVRFMPKKMVGIIASLFMDFRSKKYRN